MIGAGKPKALWMQEIYSPMLAVVTPLYGATTLNEYRNYIEKDAALERRFQKVMVDQPTVEDTITILRAENDTRSITASD